MEDRSGYVYLFLVQNKPLVKVGKAKYPLQRLKEIQTGHPDPLILFAAIKTQYPLTLENQIHRLLKTDWVRGEWFRYTKATFQKISNYCKENELQFARCDCRWNDELNCHLHGIQVFAPNYLKVYLRDGDCCSMAGCINLAKKVLPQVEIIQTFSGDRWDTRYLLHKGEWVSHLMKEVGNV